MILKFSFEYNNYSKIEIKIRWGAAETPIRITNLISATWRSVVKGRKGASRKRRCISSRKITRANRSLEGSAACMAALLWARTLSKLSSIRRQAARHRRSIKLHSSQSENSSATRSYFSCRAAPLRCSGPRRTPNPSWTATLNSKKNTISLNTLQAIKSSRRARLKRTIILLRGRWVPSWWKRKRSRANSW